MNRVTKALVSGTVIALMHSGDVHSASAKREQPFAPTTVGAATQPPGEMGGLGRPVLTTPRTVRSPAVPTHTGPGDEFWAAQFAQPGCDSVVLSVLVQGESVFVGGSFGFVGPTAAQSVALRLHGLWLPVGTGLPRQVRALCVWNGTLIAGGTFTRADGAPADYVAAYDGTGWRALGGPELDGPVNGLASVAGELYVGGEFVRAGPDTVNRIVRWDGQSWHALGTGVDGDGPIVLTLFASGDSVFVGGRFQTANGDTVHNVATWRLGQWGAVGGGVWSSELTRTGGPVRDFALWQGKTVVAGAFSYAGGMYTGTLAAWNGASWEKLGVNFGADLWAVTSLNDTLVIGGKFGRSGAAGDYNSVARQEGSSWKPLGKGLSEQDYWQPNGICSDLASVDETLLVVGRFETAGGFGFPNLASWSAERWRPVTDGQGLAFDCYAFCGEDSVLYCGGGFASASAVSASAIAAWDGASWSAMGSGFDNIVTTLTRWNGALVAGGYFGQAGTLTVNHIAAWDGAVWQPIGGGLDGNALCTSTHNDGLVVGGAFAHAAGVPALNIALWDGTQWNPLGSGLNGPVYALAEWQGLLIAGGAFTAAGGMAVNGIAAWDGLSWKALDQGVSGGGAVVYALASNGDELVAGGQFTVASGTPVSNVATWNGSAWEDVGGGVTEGVSVFGTGIRALLVRGGQLYACGSFARAGSMDANNVAKWDGTAWSPLGGGLTMDAFWRGEAFALASFQSHLLIGGNIAYAGPTPAGYLAEWKGSDSETSARHPPMPPDVGAHGMASLRLRIDRRSSRELEIHLTAPQGSALQVVITDVRGVLIRSLFRGIQSGDSQILRWDCRDAHGRHVAQGIYSITVVCEDERIHQKLTVL